MRIPAFIKRAFTAGGSSNWPPSWVASAGGFPGWGGARGDPTPVESLGIASVFRSITLLSDALSAPELRIIRDIPQGGSERVLGTDVGRALQDWAYHDKEMFLFDALLGGNGFAEIIRNARGAPAQLDTIPAWRITVEVDTTTKAKRYRVAADGTTGEQERILDAADTVHLMFRAHGRHKLLGVSPLATCAPSMGFVTVSREAGRDIYQNVSAPSFALMHPKRISAEARTRLKDSWQKAYGARSQGGNAGGRGGTAVLEEGLSVQELNLNKALDMQLVELASVNTKEISRVYGVPEHLLSETGSVNFSTASEAARAFVAFSLAPWAARVSNALTLALLTPETRSAGHRVSIDLSSLTRGAGSELSEYLSKLVNGGIIAANEARNWLNLPDVKNGEILRAPANNLPIDIWVDHDPAAAAQAGQVSESADALMDKVRKLATEETPLNAKLHHIIEAESPIPEYQAKRLERIQHKSRLTHLQRSTQQ